MSTTTTSTIEKVPMHDPGSSRIGDVALTFGAASGSVYFASIGTVVAGMWSVLLGLASLAHVWVVVRRYCWDRDRENARVASQARAKPTPTPPDAE